MATGHAAGTLAGLASQRDGLPRQVPVEEVQALLERQGAILFHPERAPGSDTARAARTG